MQGTRILVAPQWLPPSVLVTCSQAMQQAPGSERRHGISVSTRKEDFWYKGRARARSRRSA